MPYLSALEVCSQQGAIQIQVYLCLYCTINTVNIIVLQTVRPETIPSPVHRKPDVPAKTVHYQQHTTHVTHAAVDPASSHLPVHGAGAPLSQTYQMNNPPFHGTGSHF